MKRINRYKLAMNEFRLEIRRFLSNRAGKEVLEQHSSSTSDSGNLMRFRPELIKFRKGHLFCTCLLFKGIESDKPRGPFLILFPVLALLPYQRCSFSHRSQVNPKHSLCDEVFGIDPMDVSWKIHSVSEI